MVEGYFYSMGFEEKRKIVTLKWKKGSSIVYVFSIADVDEVPRVVFK